MRNHPTRFNGYYSSKIRCKIPYWNFWRVIFAGWIVRYPGTFFKIIGVPLGIMIVLIYNSVMN